MATGIRVVVEPTFDAYYYSYYLAGLTSVFGEDAVGYGRNDFPVLTREYSGFAARVDGRGGSLHLYISANDSAALDPAGLEWADVYGKVNLDHTLVTTDHAGMVRPIGPGFGIRLWPVGQSFRHAVSTFRAADRSLRQWRQHVAGYVAQYRRRLPLAVYQPAQSDPSYLFFTSWLWKRHPESNPLRATFMRAGASISGVEFEGGFAPRRRNDVPGFDDVIALRRYPLGEYLEKVKRSVVAFNTPAVHNCHGWKLGEFLALGKAIVSTPLSRSMPAPFVHGEHAHFVDGSFDAMVAAVQTIRQDAGYRRHLETGARSYWETHLRPDVVISRLTSGVVA